MQEVTPGKYRVWAGTAAQFMDSFTEVIISLYYMYISRNWIYLQYYCTFITILCVICLSIVPDSPKYLYSKGRFNDARKAFDFIQRFNRRFSPNIKNHNFSETKFDIEAKQNISDLSKVADGSIKDLLLNKAHLKNLLLFFT